MKVNAEEMRQQTDQVTLSAVTMNVNRNVSLFIETAHLNERVNATVSPLFVKAKL